MKSFLRSFFASLLALFVLFGFLFLISGFFFWQSGKKDRIAGHSYLVIDIYGKVLEYDPAPDILNKLMGRDPLTLQAILSALEKAGADERISGVIFKLSSSNTAGEAMMQEIRQGVKRIRKAGKKVYAYADSIDRKTYFLASCCDSVFMPPTAPFTFLGFSAASEHIKGTLEKLGIKPDIHRIEDYKSAAEMVTRREMSPEAKENGAWILEERWEMFLQALEKDRGFSEEEILRLMRHAVFTAEEARQNRLIDEIFYWDELEDLLKREEDPGLRVVSLSRYCLENPRKLGLGGSKKIAVIHAQGTIGGRKSGVSPFLGLMMGHKSVVAELRRAAEDDRIHAVVFRVNSGGGEALASDLIGHEVERTAGIKPVVVSMVDVAASGGYHISYRADKIVADPLTLTGSIGSISGKANMKGLYNKLGVTWDFITKGPMALMYSDYRSFTPEEKRRFEENHWAGFNDWLRDIAEHRGLPFSEAEKLAYGRVWTGRQAVANGLVDELGGLYEAAAIAKELAGIPTQEGVSLVHYPKKQGLLRLFFDGGIATLFRRAFHQLLRDELYEARKLLEKKSYCIMNPFFLE